MNTVITIDQRFCGPPVSGNGGYSCGMLANFVGNPAEITLLSPPPLGQPLSVKDVDGKKVLCHGEKAIAEGIAMTEYIEALEPPTVEQVENAVPIEGVLEKHAFPTCFVCGPHRKECDGLRIFPGKVMGRDCVAAQWIPDPSLGDGQGMVRDEIIWAALDCPGAWAAFAEHMRVIVLGKLAVHIVKKMKINDPCIVVGWKIGEEGRKLWVGTALFSETGELYAKAKATWIELKENPK